MGVTRRILAIVLALISLALGSHYLAGEIYGVYLTKPQLVWDYLNWLIAFGAIVALVYHYRKKRALDRRQHDDSVTFNYLSTNLMLFAAMFLTLWFFANWFEQLSVGDQDAGMVAGFIWIAFHASFVILGSLTAWQLWQHDSDTHGAAGEQTTQTATRLATPSGLVVGGQGVAGGALNAPPSSNLGTNPVPGGKDEDTGP